MMKKTQEGTGTLRSSSSSSSLSSRKISAENVVVTSAVSEHSEESSSSTSMTKWKHRVVNIGCMSGVFQLFSSKYYIRRKFLTSSTAAAAAASDKNPDKQKTSTPRSSTSSSSSRAKAKQRVDSSSPPGNTQPLSVPPQQQPPSSRNSATPRPPVVIRIQQQLQPSSPRNVNQLPISVNKKDSRQLTSTISLNGKQHYNRTSEEPSSNRRLSHDVVRRSPTIPAEIRRSISLDDSTTQPPLTETPQTPVPLLARLMGLNDHHQHSHITTTHAASTTPPPSSEKRRKLLGALEKCDEDLQSLKRMIESIRSTKDQTLKLSPTTTPTEGSHEYCCKSKMLDHQMGNMEQQPSPVSVLDDFNSSWSPTDEGDQFCSRTDNFTNSKRIIRDGRHTITEKRQQWIKIKTPAAAVSSTSENNNFLITSCKWGTVLPATIPRSMFLLRHQISYTPIITTFISSQNYVQSNSHHDIWTKATTTATPTAASTIGKKMMRETVNEVSREVEWGKKWEVGRIRMFIEDSIYGDLVEEFLKEMMMMMGYSCYNYTYSMLPSERCKRKLRF